MKRSVAGVVVTAGTLFAVAGFGAPAASAQTAACAPDAQRLRSSAPAYVHAGQPFELSLEDQTGRFEYRASEATATIGDVTTAADVSDGATATTELEAPSRLGRFTIAVSWQQQPSANGPGAAPCTATVELTVEALPRGATIGDLELPRVDGRWRGRSVPVGDPPGRREERGAFPISSRCEVGACDVVVGPRRDGLSLTLGRDGRYRMVRAGGLAGCVTTRTVDGAERSVTVRGVFRTRVELSMRVTASRRAATGERIATHVTLDALTRYLPTRRSRALRCGGGAVKVRYFMQRR